MTELRSRFIAHLELKNYSKSTVCNYVQVVKQFSEFTGHSPAKLTQDEIRNYLLHLKRVKKLEPKTINLHLYAIKSFCQFMLPETDTMRPRLENSMVTFAWKDYADNYRRKTMAFGFVEFIRRFLMHVVPKGFMRIRHYGFLANRNRKMKLARCRSFFRKSPPLKKTGKRTSWIEAFKALHGYDPRRCSECKLGIMEIVMVISPVRHVMTT